MSEDHSPTKVKKLEESWKKWLNSEGKRLKRGKRRKIRGQMSAEERKNIWSLNS